MIATAHELCLEGRARLARRTPDDAEAAVGCFQQAIALDPGNAGAHAGLADAYMARTTRHGLGDEWLDAAVVSAQRAVELAPEAAEGYRALAGAYYRRGWNLKQLDASRRLLALDPRQASGGLSPGWPLCFAGRADEGLPYLSAAREREPASAWASFYLGTAFQALEMHPEAEEAYGRAVALGRLSSGHLALICTYLAQGKEEQARAENERLRANPDRDRIFVKAADAELLLGNGAAARRLAEEGVASAPQQRYFPRGVYAATILGCVLWEEDRAAAQGHLADSEALDHAALAGGDDGPMPRCDLAAVHAIRGETAEALRWLRAAVDAGWRAHRLAVRDPLLATLHGDGRFGRLMAEVAELVAAARRRARAS